MLLFRKIISLKRWIIIVVPFVLIFMFQVYIFGTKFNSTDISEKDNILRGANVTTKSLESNQKWNELREWIYDLVSDNLSPTAAQKLIDTLESKLQIYGPSTEYEQLRRRIRQNTQELWNYISSELNQIKKSVSIDMPKLVYKISNVLELGAEHKRSLISDMDRMRMENGYEQWRHDEAKSLGDLMQRRLHYLQNPKDCKKARKLICRLNVNCGFGCEIHFMNYCLILAYATERTFILSSKAWKYRKAGWEDVFQPVTETCQNIDPTYLRAKEWPGQNEEPVLNMRIDKEFISWPPYLPLSIGADIAPRLIRLHGDPGAWWVGQFLKYLLRPTTGTSEMLQSRIKMLGFKKPIVGVHIRRTDKIGKEAGSHSIEEYMTHVEDYFLQLEMNGTIYKRRVFLASDEESVIIEARKKYPSYEVIGDPDVAKNAAFSSRYTDSSLNGIVSDVYMLSLSDYLVCTFSSNICRAAYEIMQTMYPDASNNFKSLDNSYFYVKQYPRISEAVLSHNPKQHNEICINTGDQIDVFFNHWNGYSKGKNTRTNQTGLFPSFKVNRKAQIVKVPTYSNIK